MVGREFRQKVLYYFKIVYKYKSAGPNHADKNCTPTRGGYTRTITERKTHAKGFGFYIG